MSTEKVSMDKVAIPIDSFFSTHLAHVDIFINIGNDKFVKLVNKGDSFELSRIKNYKDKNVTHIYIESFDFPDHVSNSIHLAKQITKNTANPVRNKVFAICSAAESIFDELQLFGFTQEALTHTDGLCECICSSSINSNEVNSLVDEIVKVNKQLARHSIGTCFIATLIGDALNWKSIKTRKALTLGALLHDIGFIQLPKNLSVKHLNDMTEEELSLYQSHPQLGFDMVKDIDGLPKEVGSIILEHHEKPNGKGFPNGLSSSSIYPLSRCISLASEISHLILDPLSPVKAASFDKAIEYLKLKEGSLYPSIYWEALAKWLRF